MLFLLLILHCVPISFSQEHNCTQCPPIISSTVCPPGHTCDDSLLVRDTWFDKCAIMRCSGGKILYGTSEQTTVRPQERLYCTSEGKWYDRNTPVTHATCTLLSNSPECPTPEGLYLPENYRYHGSVVYRPEINGFACEHKNAFLLTQGRYNEYLYEEPDVILSGRCPKVAGAGCVITYNCILKSLIDRKDSAGHPLIPKEQVLGTPEFEANDFQPRCADRNEHMMFDNNGKLDDADVWCDGMNWITSNNENLGRELAASCVEPCPPLRQSTECDSNKEICKKVTFDDSENNFGCEYGFDLSYVDKEGSVIHAEYRPLYCNSTTRKYFDSRGNPIPDCAKDFQCVKKKCIFLEIRDENFPRDNFVYPPKLVENKGEAYYTCQYDYQPFWHEFRQTPRYTGQNYWKAEGDVSVDTVNIDTVNLKCLENPKTGEFEFVTDSGQFMKTSRIACAVSKCLDLHLYDEESGYCKPDPELMIGVCAFGTSLSSHISIGYGEGRTNITSQQSTDRLAVTQGCRATVYSDSTREIISDQSYGEVAIEGEEGPRGCGGKSPVKPSVIECACDAARDVAPRLLPNGTNKPYLHSHESKYATFIDDTMGKARSFSLRPGKLNVGQSFSATGWNTDAGRGAMIIRIEDDMGEVLFSTSLNFTGTRKGELEGVEAGTKRLIMQGVAGEKVCFFFNEGGRFYFRITYLADGFGIVLNGRNISFYSHDNFPADRASVIKTKIEDHMVIKEYRFFVPKTCKKDHFFSWKTADCEFSGVASKSVELTSVDEGTVWIQNDEIPAAFKNTNDEIPAAFKNTTYKLSVRKGCAVRIGEETANKKVVPLKMNADRLLSDWKTVYNVPQCGSSNLNPWPLAIESRCQERSSSIRLETPSQIKLPAKVEAGTTIAFTARFIIAPNRPPIEINLISKLNVDIESYHDIDKYGWNHYHHKIDGGWVGNNVAHSRVNVRPGDRFECRIRINETGFEIRYNGMFTYFYTHGMTSWRDIKWLQLVNGEIYEYRQQKELPLPHKMAFDKPFKYGEYLYFNGIFNGMFSIRLSDQEGNEQISLVSHFGDSGNAGILLKIEEKGVIGETKTFSLKDGIEFDLVITNKPHALEIYVNGEFVLQFRHRSVDPENVYYRATVYGTLVLFEARRSLPPIDNSAFDK